jgi:hypothetical protein
MSLKKRIGAVPWLTEDGLDLTKYPIDSVLRQTLSQRDPEFRTGCNLLGSMAAHGRVEAGTFLVGLLEYYAADLERLEAVVEQLSYFHHESSVRALLRELRRVKSSNTTRRYLNRVLRSLSRYPHRLSGEGLEELASDSAFSPKMRAKFRAVLYGDERKQL